MRICVNVMGIFAAASVAMMCFGGCETFTPPYHSEKLPFDPANGGLIESSAEFRGVYFVPRQGSGSKKGKFYIVAEPPPDAVMASVVKATSKLNYGSIGGQGSVNVTQAITQLGQRTEAVDILRDALYRISELYADGAIDQTEVDNLYKKAISAATVIAEAERLSAAAPLAKSLRVAIVATQAELRKKGGSRSSDLYSKNVKKLQKELCQLDGALAGLAPRSPK